LFLRFHGPYHINCAYHSHAIRAADGLAVGTCG
jgi:hypothetical protein